MARQETTERNVFLAEGTGLPDQVHALKRTPVVAGSVEIFDEEGIDWKEVETLATTNPTDPVYELDPATGTLHFGDGQNGSNPGAGRALFARTYRHGGGKAGNVAPGGIDARIMKHSGIPGATNRTAADRGGNAKTGKTAGGAAA